MCGSKGANLPYNNAIKECFDECVDNDQFFVLIAKEYML